MEDVVLTMMRLMGLWWSAILVGVVVQGLRSLRKPKALGACVEVKDNAHHQNLYPHLPSGARIAYQEVSYLLPFIIHGPKSASTMDVEPQDVFIVHALRDRPTERRCSVMHAANESVLVADLLSSLVRHYEVEKWRQEGETDYYAFLAKILVAGNPTAQTNRLLGDSRYAPLTDRWGQLQIEELTRIPTST